MGTGVVEWTANVSGTQATVLRLDNANYEFWSPSDFTFTVPNDAAHRTMLLGTTGYAGGGKPVQLHRIVNKGTPKLMMTGSVYRVRASNDTIQVVGKGNGIKLSRDVTGDNVYYINESSITILGDLLSGTTISLGATSTDAPNVSCRFYAENKWRATMDFVKNMCNWEANVESDDTLTFKNQIGTDKSASFTMQYGENVISDGYRDIDYEQLASRVKVRGEGEGFNQLKVSAVDASVESNYWSRMLVYDDRSIDNATLAANVANSRLSAVNAPRDQISLQTLDSFNPNWNLALGDTVKVDWPRLALDTSMRIKGLRYSWDMNSGETINIDLNRQGRKIQTAMAGTNPGLVQQVETNARHPQGATNFWQINDHDNCSSSYPMYIPFRIPNICKKVNRATLSLKIKPFRYHSKNTAGGGGGTTAAGGDEVTAAGGATTPTTAAAGAATPTTSAGGDDVTASGGGATPTTSAGGDDVTANSPVEDLQAGANKGFVGSVTTTWKKFGTWTAPFGFDTAMYWTDWYIRYDDDKDGLLTLRMEDEDGNITDSPQSPEFKVDGHGKAGKFGISNFTSIKKGYNINGKDIYVWVRSDLAGSYHVSLAAKLFARKPHTHGQPTHSHTVSISAHTHGQPTHSHAVTLPTHSHTVYVPSHTHAQPTHSHAIGTHSHTVATGISTVAYDGDAFSVTAAIEKYDSGSWNTAWSATTSFADVDIQTWVSSPNSNYQLRLTPNQDCRLEAQLQLEGYFQSRSFVE